MIVAATKTLNAHHPNLQGLLDAEEAHLRSTTQRLTPPAVNRAETRHDETPGAVADRWRAKLEAHAGWTARPPLNLPPHPSHLDARPPSFTGGLTRGPAVLTIALGKSEDLLFRTLAAWHFQQRRDDTKVGVLLTPTTRTARTLRGNVHPYGTYLAIITMLELTHVDTVPLLLVGISHDPNDPEIHPHDDAREHEEAPP